MDGRRKKVRKVGTSEGGRELKREGMEEREEGRWKT